MFGRQFQARCNALSRGKALGAITGAPGRGEEIAAMDRGQAMPACGIALAKVALGETMEAEEEMIEVVRQEWKCHRREGVKILRLFEKRRDETPGHSRDESLDLLIHMRGGGRVAGHRVLREQRKNHQLPDASGKQAAKRKAYGGILVPHSERNRKAEGSFELYRQRTACGDKRRSCLGPD